MKPLFTSTAPALSLGLATAAYADDAAPQPPADSAMPASVGGDILVDQSGKTVLAPHAMTARDLIGATVIGPDGKDVGSVDDLVLGAGDEIQQVIIADGAIFGLGGKKVAVDYAGSQLSRPGVGAGSAASGEATAGTGADPVVRVSLTEEALDRGAEFDKSGLEAQGDRLASSYIDRDVKLAANDAEGEISDLLLDQSGTVKYAVIAFGGVLNIGESKVAVDIDRLSGAPRDQPMRLSMTEAELEAAPKFDAAP
ncbi:MAG: PRC-barrel domain-containing protein [Alphaproteobacteria bacterium]